MDLSWEGSLKEEKLSKQQETSRIGGSVGSFGISERDITGGGKNTKNPTDSWEPTPSGEVLLVVVRIQHHTGG